MKLISIISQNRRDFKWKYKCENCKHIKITSWYDDDNFHNNVTPNWKCEQCGKTSNDMWIKNKVTTKYEARQTV